MARPAFFAAFMISLTTCWPNAMPENNPDFGETNAEMALHNQGLANKARADNQKQVQRGTTQVIVIRGPKSSGPLSGLSAQ